MRPTPADERFWAKVDKSGPIIVEALGQCWVWTAYKDDDGYGSFWPSDVAGTQRAHRFSYEARFGPIPESVDGQRAELDHLCRNRACVNPLHLEVVSQQENRLRSFSPPAVNARKTHCVRGHRFDEENTLVSSSGGRRCRKCSTPLAEFRSLTPLEAEEFGFLLDKDGNIA